MEIVKEQNEKLASQLIDKIKLLNQNQQEKIISLVDTFLEEKQEYEEKISRLIIEKTKKENGGKLYKEQLSYSVEDIKEIVNLFPKHKKWTAEELEDEAIFPLDLMIKVEIINYQICIESMPIPYHQLVLGNAATYLCSFTDKYKLGQTYISPVAIQSRKGYVLVPDILFISNNDIDAIEENYICKAPSLVVEVLFPTDSKQLIEIKRKEYADFGVREYWEIYPKKQKINVEVLTEIEDNEEEKTKATYQLFSTAAKTGKIKSKVLEGFELDIENIF